ncbi:Histone acetyltransferase type B subunit 2 [Coniosporium tulheliwenetii]|uniref:Histone acetyltransferase type B subunit 2 n=1 Tax=Coniosporium tulheliwenetii TaxID=3383036 RepID=A0ACC2YXD3_9PEZI|nr:Histone acetyltransferase type B subunit 2 [Cladosporium sp. JES 115]
MDDIMTDAQQEYQDEHMEQKIINEEYKIWKKNSVWLYDQLFARALDWPTLTTQWLPDKREVLGTNLSQHRLLFGTFTANGAQNYLQIASIEIPEGKAPDPADYDEQRGEIGGYGNAKKPFAFNIIQKINHPGEVNKARYQPQNPNIIASYAVDGRILIFDRTKHSSNPKSDGVMQFEMELHGHTDEGFGLDWSPHTEGQLATGGSDNTVRVWNIKDGFSRDKRQIEPQRTYTHHASIVNDVQHHPIHHMWIGTVSDDLTLQVIDTRNPSSKKALYKKDAHTDAVNCIAFHPKWEPIVATGSADKTIALWDLRNLSRKLHAYEGHKDAVMKLEWHPTEMSILASSSYDRRILMWDASQIGEEQTEEEAEDGPPELLFMHGGFTNRICDFSWNKNNPWTMLASAEDNQIQVFRPARALVNVAKPRVPHNEVSE